jgi:hypothetical protein
MNKVEIINILKDWNFWEKPWEEGILRSFYVEKMRGHLNSGQVLIVTGARRSGKSFLMKQLASALHNEGVEKKNILFINFEDPRWLKRDAALLFEIVETYRELMQPGEKPYIFLDEIQEVEGWERWVRTMHELNKATLIVSGSNAKLLGRELGTVLTGRHLDIEVYPLSFREFLEFKGTQLSPNLRSASEIRGYLREYFARGTFPALVFLQSGAKEWFLDYYDDVLEKDVIKRFKIRKIEQLKALLNFYMSNISKLSTFNSVAKFLKISPDTAEKFTAYFEQSYLLFPLKRFSFGFKEQQKSPRKIYSVDTALAGAIGFRMSDDFGRVAENIVYLEYLRRKITNPGYELFYWKDEQSGRDGKEVDFVVKDGNHIVEITQVCMGNLAEDAKKRELRAIAKAVKKLNPEKIIIITDDYESEEDFGGRKIQYIPLWRWLLDA